MRFPYRPVAKRNPRKPGESPRYYAQDRYTGEVDLRELARRIAVISTLSEPDMVAALEALIFAIPQYLAEGKIVRLGDFGTFRLILNSRSADSAAEVSAGNIRSWRVHFRPGKVFREKLRPLQYRRISPPNMTKIMFKANQTHGFAAIGIYIFLLSRGPVNGRRG